MCINKALRNVVRRSTCSNDKNFEEENERNADSTNVGDNLMPLISSQAKIIEKLIKQDSKSKFLIIFFDYINR